MRKIILLLAVLLWSPFGCSQTKIGQECKNHTDCGTIDGVQTLCMRDVGKEGAFTCVRACPQKNGDAECIDGEKCIQADCITPDQGCWGQCKATSNPTPSKCDPACASGETCKNGKCQKQTSGTCTPACRADYECQKGKCIRTVSKKECSSDRDCVEGTDCNRAAKLCQKPCKKDDECKDKKVCIDNFCQKKPDKPACEKSSVRPPPRSEMMGVFDAKRRRLVFFGGDDGLPVNCSPGPHPVGLNDLWIYDAICATFKKVEAANPPPGRARGMAVYDTTKDRMIIFGGRARTASRGPYTNFNEAWALDLKTLKWQKLNTTGPKPVARSNPAGAYNHLTKEMIVFGGNSSTSGLRFQPHNDVFALNLETNTWREISATGTKPKARLFHSAAVDPKGNRLFVYGGGDANAWQGPFLGDLWVMDLKTATWTQLHDGKQNAPKGRIWSTITYDQGADRVLLFAGHDDGQVGNNNDTWEFDLKTKKWSSLTKAETVKNPSKGFCNFPPFFTEPNLKAPDRRSAHIAALDNTRREWIVFGGKTDCGLIDDVWTFDLQRNEWIRLMASTKGEACVRGDNPKLCVALCK